MIKPFYYLAKIDIKSAYRQIPIHPKSYEATGLQWKFSDGKTHFMYDSKLPFGARASPTIFHRLSQTIKRMMFRKGFHKIVAYQDDFLIIGESYSQRYEAWVTMLELLNKLGLQINKEKLSEPSQNVVFLGILLNTISCTASLPPEKLDQIRNEVNLFLEKCRASKHQ